MQGGGFSVTGQGSVTGSGVLLVNAPSKSSETFAFTGQGNVTLSAPTGLTGPYAPYNGIAMFQDPSSSAPIQVTGQGVLAVTGRIYAPLATLNVTGNGGVVDAFDNDIYPTQPGAIIVFDAKVTGDGSIQVNLADPPSAAAASGGAADVNSAALNALMSGGGLSGPGTLTDQEAMNEVAMSLAGNADLFSSAIGAAKKK